jgi:hypothetical protein
MALEEVLGGPAMLGLLRYLHLPETRAAVVLPGLASLAILGFYARAGRISDRLQLLWFLALPVSYYCASWVVTSEYVQLYIYSAFSVACALLLFHRYYVPPALAFALTFLALWWVDVTRALCWALECGVPLEYFYRGVGGAGLRDGLVVIPLLTAVMVMYATRRIRAQGEQLTSY